MGDDLVFVSRERTVRKPISQLTSVVIYGKIAISSDVFKRLAVEDVSLIFLSRRGKPLFAIIPFWREGELIRRWRRQLQIPWRLKAQLQKYFAYHALYAKRRLLLSLARNRSRYAPDIAEQLRLHAAEIAHYMDEIRRTRLKKDIANTLRGFEGNGSKAYWRALSLVLPDEVYCGSRDRYSNDAFNKALNIGYGILASYVYSSLWAVGLNPYIGIYHSDLNFERPALVFDLMELFRQPLVDRPILKLFIREGYRRPRRITVIKTVEDAILKALDRVKHEAENLADVLA